MAHLNLYKVKLISKFDMKVKKVSPQKEFFSHQGNPVPGGLSDPDHSVF